MKSELRIARWVMDEKELEERTNVSALQVIRFASAFPRSGSMTVGDSTSLLIGLRGRLRKAARLDSCPTVSAQRRAGRAIPGDD